MSAIFIDNHLVHYEVIGRGKPVIFLHSWFGSWRYWVPTMQTISIINRAYALDLWGFGESAKNKQYSIGQQTELLNSFFERIGLFQCTLVGHGLGGLVAHEFSRNYPDSVEKLMLIAYPLAANLLNLRNLVNEPMSMIDKLVKSKNDLDIIKNDVMKNDPEVIKLFENDLKDDDFLQLRNIIKKPSLFVYGASDLIVKTPDIENFFTQVPESHLIVFENTGHFPMVEESSKFSRLLNEFLELSEEDSPRNLQIKEKWQRRVR